MKIERVSIIGLGALGILFGNQLSKNMPFENLRIIADSDRIKRYKRDGVYCNKEVCNFNYMTPDEICEPADLLIFSVKFSGLSEAIEMVKKHVADNTIILSALNGIISEELISEKYGKEKIILSVAQGMDAVKEGNSLSYSNKGLVCFGETKEGLITERAKALAAFFDKTGLPYEIVDDMEHRLWSKFMLNVGVNQTVAIYKGNYGTIQKPGKERDTMISAMGEAMAIARHNNINLSDKDLDYWLKILNTLSPEGKPSMAQDIEAKRHSEVELFAGTVLRYGKKYGIDTPVNQELYNKITEIEKDVSDS